MLRKDKGIFLDIGADEGLFAVYLADTVLEVIAIEGTQHHFLRRNLTANTVGNYRICSTLDDIHSEEFGELTNIVVMRVNSPAVEESINSVAAIIQSCQPIILIHLPASTKESSSCKELLSNFGYAVEHLFELHPQIVLCTTAKHRDNCRWLLG
jgi:hypothetical protein